MITPPPPHNIPPDPIPPATAPHQARKWQKMNAQRYASKRKFGYQQAPKEDMPPGECITSDAVRLCLPA